MQLSAWALSHAPQLAPPIPQLASVLPTKQVLPEQHPPHELASQMHAPPEQRCPVAQVLPVPQRQLPLVQLSARVASQAMQAAPPVLQALNAGVVQVLPEQQPFGQVCVLQPVHTPSRHCCEPGQLWQLAPPAPHAAVEFPGRQVLPEQQPLGHDVASHTQVPLTQRWPAPHGLFVPHWHSPAAVQVFAREASHAAQVDPFAPQ